MRALRSALILAACLLLVAVLNGFRTEGVAPPRSYDPGPDGWAHAPHAVGRVDQVHLATTLQSPTSTATIATAKVFVVIDVTIGVRGRSQPFSTARLVTADGHTYDRLGDYLIPGLELTQPGYTVRGTVAFEVPPERVDGATLVIAAQSDLLVVYRAQLRFPRVVQDGPVAPLLVMRPGSVEVTR